MAVEDYYIKLRVGSICEKDSMDSKGKKLRCYQELYETKEGKLTPEEWRMRIQTEIEQSGETQLLEKLKEYCRRHYAWLHDEEEICNYAMNILAGRFYRRWKNFKEMQEENFEDLWI